MNKHEFIQYCRQQIAQNFENTKNLKDDGRSKHRTEGVLHAARLLKMLTSDEIIEMVEQEHQTVFGESVIQRKNRNTQLAELKLAAPDDYYEIPAFERNKTR